MDICLPSFIFEGMTFTCSTLRKRLRVISVSLKTVPGDPGSSSSNGAGNVSLISADRSRGQFLNNLVRTPGYVDPSDIGDYFGNTTNSTSSDARETHLLMSSPTTGVDRVLNPPRQDETVNTGYADGSSFDWTRLPLTHALPRHIQFTRSIDWASTALGPIESWSFDLRAMCNLIMGSPHVSKYSP